MPTCKKCGEYGASANFRRVPGSPINNPSWLCKDKVECGRRQDVVETEIRRKGKEKR